MRKNIRVDEIIDRVIPYNDTYVINIKHGDYPITLFFRTAERFKDKLRDYTDYIVEAVIENKKTRTFTIYIKGRLPSKPIERRTKLIKDKKK